ncbi:sodium:proton exchanger [Candidatus Peregrinibacteria bacterium HGW-Peregrinibacteria-1]|nr:MAG: sodium:proton exchanger [Candidatus Peregrinibacteria bacterium HGW-Peregrinibacteria-1]
MLISILLLLVGLVILIYGADFLVKGASSISKKLGVPAIVIGLTIVAFGTSAPELIINLFSAAKGTTDLALGNVLGSNVANIFLVLGVSGLIIPLSVKKNTTWKEIPFATLAMFMILFAGNDIFLDGSAFNVISRSEGLVLLGFFAIFMYYTFELFRSGRGGESEGDEIAIYGGWASLGFVLLGLLGLFFGGQLLVNNAIELAKMAGMSEMLIGLTVVAVGTSLPELATSVVAARKGQTDLAIGNVVGSNIFNIFWILGVTSVIKPIPVSDGASVDIFITTLASFILFVVMFVGKKHVLQRWQAGMFVIFYIVYVAYLIYRG